jgi:hypothetical protein
MHAAISRRARRRRASLHGRDRAWLAGRLPQAEVAVWPAGHHCPHLSRATRFARPLGSLAADHHA